ncbi:MAG: hypothetical protein ACLUD1_07570 [Clostridia bacterium]
MKKVFDVKDYENPNAFQDAVNEYVEIVRKKYRDGIVTKSGYTDGKITVTVENDREEER